MDPNGFLMALGDFLVDMVGAPVKVLVDFWNEMTQVVDTVTPGHPVSCDAIQLAPWFTDRLWTMRRQGTRLDWQRRNTWGKSKIFSNLVLGVIFGLPHIL